MMGWGNMMGGWGNNPGTFFFNGWFGIISMVLQFVFWTVLIVIVYKMFRSKGLKAAKEQNRSGDKALEILRMRYAKGEINTEEYNQRKTLLE